MANIKALFFDIDGTLVSFKTHHIPASAIEALERAKSKGIKIFISTGRPKKLINNLGEIEHLIDGYITTNGAYCFSGNDVIVCKPLPEDDVRKIMAYVDHTGVSCIVVGTEDLLVCNITPELKEVEKLLNIGVLPTSGSVDDLLKQGIVQITPFFSVEQERKLMPDLKNCISGRWTSEFTDITVGGADKGKGIEAVAAYFGFSIEETMAFGDGGNDIQMLQKAGIGVAMGNAVADVRKYADYVTAEIDNDGVYAALRHFSLI